ncbi:Cytotoxic and regulatory T-cell molecule [Merluccius polli]|uniref:Cytotoxic and regulatory T-cell molecule n=1 Tax=Merluccius polli TaxID=89951 RepID=A0AA47MBD6_MERPO|nr:Cytotoxic and regulatory T-cell molecule [Merluccius polli]
MKTTLQLNVLQLNVLQLSVPLQLSVLLLLPHSVLAGWSNVTVFSGATLTLSCPLVAAHSVSAEWTNPQGAIMFFNRQQGFKDKRYSIEKLSSTKFTVSVSDVSFQDGGNYKCTQYLPEVRERTVAVTVVALHQHTHEGRMKKHRSDSQLSILVFKPEVICCVVRHPDLHTEPLEDCKTVRPTANRSPWTIPTRSPDPQRLPEPRGSPAPLRGTTEVPASSTVSPTGRRPDATTTKSRQTTRSPADQSQEPTDSWRGTTNETRQETAASTGLYPNTSATHVAVTEVTDGNMTLETSHNSTEGNSTQRNLEEKEKREHGHRSGRQTSSPLMILLVTCLIVALSVVLLFLAIKLRRAHIHWKRENEDSDPSRESNASKSSDEERRWPGQKCRGIFNISYFTKYVSEEPPVITAPASAAAAAPADPYVPPADAWTRHAGPYDDEVPAPPKETEL